MCLQIYTQNSIVDVELNPWFKNGIDESDIVLGKALGLIEDPDDIEPFDKMVDLLNYLVAIHHMEDHHFLCLVYHKLAGIF